MFKLLELGIATHVMKMHDGMERWPHDHKGMKHEVKIMVKTRSKVIKAKV